ncbi:MAG: alpha/beta hydrolase [Chitinophagaceae bacterium]
MKKIFFILFILSAFCVKAQQQYTTEKNIHYYSDSINNKDVYIKSQCVLDIYYPENEKNFATIVWFHGGGLTRGEKQIPKALMNKDYAVIGVEYRLSPAAKAPAYIEDAAAAVAWVFNNIKKYGGNTKLIFLSGHSAGAYLNLMITLDKSYLKKYNINADSIAAIIPFSGQAITHFAIRKEQGIKSTQPVIDKYAPLYFVREDAPPMLLITGDRELELLGRYEENAYLLRMMKLAGHKRTRLYELQGFDHGGMDEPAFPLLVREVAAISKEIKGWIKKF